MLTIARRTTRTLVLTPALLGRAPFPARVRSTYSAAIIEHYENPKNVGSLDKNKRSTGTGLVGAPACGDVMKLQIEVDDEGRIVDSKFKTFGCGSAIASASVTSEWVKGKLVDDVLGIKNTDIAKHLNLPPVKLHCSMLAEDAIKSAVQDWKNKNPELAAKMGGNNKSTNNSAEKHAASTS